MWHAYGTRPGKDLFGNLSLTHRVDSDGDGVMVSARGTLPQLKRRHPKATSPSLHPFRACPAEAV
jgi:hypothetical protein